MIIHCRLWEYYSGLSLEERANAIVNALEWANKNIPMRNPSLMKPHAANGIEERAGIREPSTITTNAVSTCQFLRIINVDLGGEVNVVDIQKSATWAIVSKWLKEYRQRAGGGLSPQQQVFFSSY